jgi:polyhydroxyalkanoate synthesis repressor PhaR
MPPNRVIKKYPNRRLYDTEISSYITLEDVRQLIVDREAFEVRDARTGDDLTRAVLLQIIAEQEQEAAPMFCTSLLAQVIRCYGSPVQAQLGPALERSLEAFLLEHPPTPARPARRATAAAPRPAAPAASRGTVGAPTPWSMLDRLTERPDGWQEPAALRGTLGPSLGDSAAKPRR